MKIKFWEAMSTLLWKLGMLSVWHYAVRQAMNAQIEQDLITYAWQKEHYPIS